MNKPVLAILAAAFVANVAIADSIVEVNGVLADASGRTLYTFDKDADNKSNCNGGCAAAWPPYLVKEGDRNPANIGVVRRDDNTLQWALNGKPLYFFAADAKAGDAKGDGQGGVWHAARAADLGAMTAPAAMSRAAGIYDSYLQY